MATDTHSETGAETHGSAGMPQLDPASYGNQIFWLVVALVAIYMLLSKIALPRIGGILEARSDAIQRDLNAAVEMKRKAEEAEQAYNDALAQARSDALAIAEENKAEIQSELDAATAKADAEIAKQASKSAKKIAKLQEEAEASIGEIAGDVASHIIGLVAPQVADDKSIAGAVKKLVKG